jgi:predicted secreted protein
MDLLQPLEGRRRRLERIYPGRIDGPIEEWQLRWDVDRFLEAINRAPDMADRLLRSCLNDGPLGRVVFLTERHFVHCRGPESTTGMSEFDEMLVELTIRTNNNEGSRQYGLFLDGPDDPAVLRCMLKVTALATCISSVDVHLIEVRDEIPLGIVPAMQDFVSMARSRRTVLPCFTLWPEMARVLAFHCCPLVDLIST